MRLLPLLWPLPLVLVIHACGGGGGHGSPPDTDAGGLPPGLFSLAGAGGGAASGVPTTVDDAGPQVQFGDDAEVVGTLDAGAVGNADAEVPNVDAGVDAAVDAGHDAGPPPLAGTCESCTVDADCLWSHLCEVDTAAGGRFCFPRAGTPCGEWPGGYLYDGAGHATRDGVFIQICTPYDTTMIVGTDYPKLTCAQWHTLTGL